MEVAGNGVTYFEILLMSSDHAPLEVLVLSHQSLGKFIIKTHSFTL